LNACKSYADIFLDSPTGYDIFGDRSNLSAQTAVTEFICVNGTQIAYRKIGKPSETPLVYITHFRGSMDTTDPLLINTIAQNRQVIIYDNVGIGHSDGTVPDSIEAMTDTTMDFLSAINVTKADILGFSMGGYIAQAIGMDYPQLVNKLVLAGVGPGAGPDVFETDRNAAQGPGGEPDRAPTEDYMLGVFFYPSNTSLAKGRGWWQRAFERNVEGEERKDFLVGVGVGAQGVAIGKFSADSKRYEGLNRIDAPVLVTNGHTDRLMGTGNSFVLSQQLPSAMLIVFPDSAHGQLFEDPIEYGSLLDIFLGN
jgi:pimeloyl-ACP methyl ester carboxylesterase